MKKLSILLIIFSLIFVFGCSEAEELKDEISQNISVDDAVKDIISNSENIIPETTVDGNSDSQDVVTVDNENEVSDDDNSNANNDDKVDTDEQSNSNNETSTSNDDADSEDNTKANPYSDQKVKELKKKLEELEELETKLVKSEFDMLQDPVEELDRELDLYKVLGYDSRSGDLVEEIETEYFD